ncbi:MAG TPA: hypothetical protein VF188_12545 [Longimicrobiales bacterium]
MARAIQAIARLLPDDRMRVVFRLMATGERRSAIFAAALGLTGSPMRQQQREVKREKDRFWKYVTRHSRIPAIARKALA